MQDPRLGLVATVALSLAAFVSAWGALLAFAWWLLATPRRLPVRRWRPLLGLLLLVAATSAVVALSGGDGLSYLLRMAVILLIATWAFGERKGGEFLDTATWALGERAGFELGLVAEMAVQSLEVLEQDLSMLSLALRLKGRRAGARSLASSLGLLVRRELERGRDLGDLLAVRGYRKGGRHCPRFSRGPREAVQAGAAVGIAALALLL